MTQPDTYRTLYGDEEGHWLLVTGPCGVISPPWIDVGIFPGRVVRLHDLGSPNDLMCRLHAQHRGGKFPIQAALARLFEVTQQQLSRYVNGDSAVPDAALPLLVALWFSPRLVEDAVGEILAGHAAEHEAAVVS